MTDRRAPTPPSPDRASLAGTILGLVVVLLAATATAASASGCFIGP